MTVTIIWRPGAAKQLMLTFSKFRGGRYRFAIVFGQSLNKSTEF